MCGGGGFFDSVVSVGTLGLSDAIGLTNSRARYEQNTPQVSKAEVNPRKKKAQSAKVNLGSTDDSAEGLSSGRRKKKSSSGTTSFLGGLGDNSGVL